MLLSLSLLPGTLLLLQFWPPIRRNRLGGRKFLLLIIISPVPFLINDFHPERRREVTHTPRLPDSPSRHILFGRRTEAPEFWWAFHLASTVSPRKPPIGKCPFRFRAPPIVYDFPLFVFFGATFSHHSGNARYL